jgi:hypothetical protein
VPLDAQVSSTLRAGLQSRGTPEEILQALVQSVTDLVDNFVAGRLRPSELSAGDFVEASARLLQFLGSGSFTPLGKTLPRFDRLLVDLENSQMDDAFRIHVPRLLQVIYDVRNRRGVGHLPGPVSANRADAEFLLASVKWVLAEFLRITHAGSHDAAQRLIDRLVVRHVPLVEDFEGTRRLVSKRNFSLPDAILILLASVGGETTRSELAKWSGAPGRQFATAIARLDSRNLIHRFSDGRVRLTSLGSKRGDGLLGRT